MTIYRRTFSGQVDFLQESSHVDRLVSRQLRDVKPNYYPLHPCHPKIAHYYQSNIVLPMSFLLSFPVFFLPATPYGNNRFHSRTQCRSRPADIIIRQTWLRQIANTLLIPYRPCFESVIYSLKCLLFFSRQDLAHNGVTFGWMVSSSRRYIGQSDPAGRPSSLRYLVPLLVTQKFFVSRRSTVLA